MWLTLIACRMDLTEDQLLWRRSTNITTVGSVSCRLQQIHTHAFGFSFFFKLGCFVVTIRNIWITTYSGQKPFLTQCQITDDNSCQLQLTTWDTTLNLMTKTIFLKMPQTAFIPSFLWCWPWSDFLNCYH